MHGVSATGDAGPGVTAPIDLRGAPSLDHAPGLSGVSGRHGLDAFVFFVSNLQTGFGPFVAVYLTQQSWTQADIGIVMTVGGLVGMLGQVPGGAIVDRARSKVMVAAVSVAIISLSALMLGLWAGFASALVAMAVHSVASCTLTPSISTISLGLVGHARAGERFGRNASLASAGGAIAAVGMGACGYYLSDASVFFVTALLGIPALLALIPVGRDTPVATPAAVARDNAPVAKAPSVLSLASNRPLLAFAGCVCLFHFANASMLNLAGSVLTLRSSGSGSPLIAACIVVPQVVVALAAAWVGRSAQRHGRRPFLIVCFAALAARGALFAYVQSPYAFVVIQLLDGVSAAVLGVMMPLVIADTTRETGHFNLAFGAVATAMGIGASLSTTLFGFVADWAGMSAAFLGMAAIAFGGMIFTAFVMPETRPPDDAGLTVEEGRADAEPGLVLPGRSM